MIDDFDPQEGERLKQQGLFRATMNKQELLKLYQAEAFIICNRKGTVCADDVGRAMSSQGYPSTLGPAMGALFNGAVYEICGSKKSARTSNRRGRIMVWRFKRDTTPNTL